MKKIVGGLITAFLFPSIISVSTSFAAARRSPLPDRNLPGTTHQTRVASVARRESKKKAEPFTVILSSCFKRAFISGAKSVLDVADVFEFVWIIFLLAFFFLPFFLLHSPAR